MSAAVGEPPAEDLHAAYRRHLDCDVLVDAAAADDRQRFEALARAIRDRLAQKWLATDRAYSRADPKRVYYLSLEYLPGRVLASHLASLGLAGEAARLAALESLDLDALAAAEPDPALGNGGLGRLAACYLDSLATLGIPAMGYGLRYQYGIFRQEIIDGRQVERPDNWLLRPDPWEVARHREAVQDRRLRRRAEEGKALGLLHGMHVTLLLGRGQVEGLPAQRALLAQQRRRAEGVAAVQRQ